MWSLNKILLLVGVVLAVWYGFRLWQRINTRRAEGPERVTRRQAAPGATSGAARRDRGRAGNVEDMRACPVCGVYVAGGSGPCERGDCPRR